VQYYARLSESQKQSLQRAMEKAARRYGVSEEPVASNDQDGFAGIMQYVETLLARFDTDNGQTFSLSEALDAYPVFKGPLAEFGEVTGYPDIVIKTIFTYVIHYGHPPEKNFWGYVSLAKWAAEMPIWKYLVDSDRLKLYQVIESLAQPQPLPGSSSLMGMGMMAKTLSGAEDKGYAGFLQEYGVVDADQRFLGFTVPELPGSQL
jgi:hypothetical protein